MRHLGRLGFADAPDYEYVTKLLVGLLGSRAPPAPALTTGFYATGFYLIDWATECAKLSARHDQEANIIRWFDGAVLEGSRRA